jgi:hypothetical protein
MAPVKSTKTKERDIARRLRVEGKKSFPEIAAITGVNQSTVCRWAQAEGWPDPNKERQELKEILANKTEEGQSSEKKPEKKWHPISPAPAGQNKVTLPDDLPEIDYDLDLEVLSKQLFKWAAKVAEKSAGFSIHNVLKLLEVSARVAVSTHTPKPGEIRRLTVMIPGEIESYRDEPEDS